MLRPEAGRPAAPAPYSQGTAPAALSATRTVPSLRDDASLGIDWGVSAAVLSAKDAVAPAFADLDSPFVYAEPEGGRA
jgi:hypothetical protein